MSLSWHESYKRKLISGEAAAAMVKDHMWIDYGAMNAPKLFDRALAARMKEVKGVKLRTLGCLHFPAIMEADKQGESFWLGNWHIVGLTRKYIKEGRASYIPMNFGECGRYYQEDLDPVDIAVLVTTPMNKHGYFNFGVGVSESMAVLKSAKIKIVETYESMPWVYGGFDESIHISEIDYVIENKVDKIFEGPAPPPETEDVKIAELIAERIPLNGPCLQVGIGGIPDQLIRVLGRLGVKDIGIHTEMVTEAIAELAEAGVLTCRKKSFLPGKIPFTFAIGSRKLYDWMDHNPMLYGCPVSFTNDPNVISLNENFISLNAALGMDLQGQVNAESISTGIFTGTGGQPAIARAAYYRSSKGIAPIGYPGNKAFIAFHSTYKDKDGKLQSRIMPTLRLGEIVTTTRTDVSYLVTEYGVAYLKGLSIPERALALIKIAHPDFRDWLKEEGQKLGWLPRLWAMGHFVGTKKSKAQMNNIDKSR
jgi:acyl-CoA hydrolase